MNGLICKTIASIFCVILVLSTPAIAAAFRFERAISMDQWVIWPPPDRWNEDEVIDNFPEWRSYVSDKEIEVLKEVGLDSVRLPIDPAFLLHLRTGDKRERAINGMHIAIKRILKADLKVIVDLHTIPREEVDIDDIGLILKDNETFERYVKLVERLATELVSYDAEDVALEVINEPTIGCDNLVEQSWVESMMVRLHAVARVANPSVTIALTGGCWGSAQGLANMGSDAIASILSDENTLWTFHSYEPFLFTHQSASWVGEPISEFKNLPYPPSLVHEQDIKGLPHSNRKFIDPTLRGKVRTDAAWYIRNELEALRDENERLIKLEKPFQQVAQWAAKNKISPNRIYLGEFGFIRQEYGKKFATDPAWRIAYLNDMISLAEKHEFGWSIWSFGGAFGMVQGFDGKPLKQNLLEKLLHRSELIKPE